MHKPIGFLTLHDLLNAMHFDSFCQIENNENSNNNMKFALICLKCNWKIGKEVSTLPCQAILNCAHQCTGPGTFGNYASMMISFSSYRFQFFFITFHMRVYIDCNVPTQNGFFGWWWWRLVRKTSKIKKKQPFISHRMAFWNYVEFNATVKQKMKRAFKRMY